MGNSTIKEKLRADAPILCTALGGDHNKDCLGSVCTEFVLVSPRSYSTDFLYIVVMGS